MFERFTQSTRRAIFFARKEAGDYGSGRIEVEHLLLGILQGDPSLSGTLSAASTRNIRTEIEKQVVRYAPIPIWTEIPLSDDCMAVLMQAGNEAEGLGEVHVTTEHFVRAILKLEHSVAARLLRGEGVK